MAGDGLGRVGMIAGQHDHPNARRSGRIGSPREHRRAQGREGRRGRSDAGRRRAPPRRRRHASSPAPADADRPVRPRCCGRAKRCLASSSSALCPAAAGQDLGADVEHRLGRALDRHEVAITILVHGGHHLEVGIEGVLPRPRAGPWPGSSRPSWAFCATDRQRHLHRVAGVLRSRHRPRHRPCHWRLFLGIGAERAHLQRPGEAVVVFLAPAARRPRGGTDRRHPCPPRFRHRRAGMRTTVIRFSVSVPVLSVKDNRGRAQRFDGRKLRDQRVARAHPPHPPRQAERGDDGQPPRAPRPRRRRDTRPGSSP